MIRTKCCKSTEIYVVTGKLKINLQDLPAIMKLKLDGDLEGKTFHYQCGACEKACDVSSRPYFSTEQIDWICYQIGEWYLLNKNTLVNYEQKTHKLGHAKELLKIMICGDEEQ